MKVQVEQAEASVKRRRQRIARGNVYDANCPTRVVLNHLTSRWGSLVLVFLLDGPMRFSELARGIGGVSEKMLAQTLQLLEGDGIVLRTVYPTIPPKVEYRLTPLGEDVATRVYALTDWVESHLPQILQHRRKQESAK